MTARSAVHVYVVSKDGTRRKWLEPGDDVPDWARLDDRNLEGADGDSAAGGPSGVASGQVAEPSRSGKGSGTEAWRTFAESKGVGVGSDMSRDDIIAACEQAGVVSSEG
ncbi:hypothetical protein AB0D78_28175 [Streptomyces avermitilis]|uniref:hypothetical protein n=1 Tax=Streptomyces avermitilis TaxID=33903 RepID=UPI0033E04249